jgi:radical SAM superfamily enzyme YgiQ (UPF0313 family)
MIGREERWVRSYPVKVLLVYPEYPETFWSFRYALKFVKKMAAYPPLGLLTIASILPEDWEKRVLDLNVDTLTDADLRWADMVFVSAMDVQRESASKIIRRCKELGVTTVAGGPLFTSCHEDFGEVDHFVLGEAEETLPEFVEDVIRGEPKKKYQQRFWADLKKSPPPTMELVDIQKYQCMSIQYSRGCPYHCEFCDVTYLFGKSVRTKSGAQVIGELEQLYTMGWRGCVFFVDDNFIGNRRKLKEEILPSIISWMRERDYPFEFITQASIDIADDDALIQMMVEAGFDEVFIGIETVDHESLKEAGKSINRNRDVIRSVKKLHRCGMQVKAGFIVGFDSDNPTVFDRMIKFIQDSAITTAMVGLLNAPRGTELYKRLEREGRLIFDTTGNNTDFTINFIPKMNGEVLMKGYRRIVEVIYSPPNFTRRLKKFLSEYKPLKAKGTIMKKGYLGAFVKSIFILGILEKGRLDFWKIVFWSAFRRPSLFPLAVKLYICGYHFRKIFQV